MDFTPKASISSLNDSLSQQASSILPEFLASSLLIATKGSIYIKPDRLELSEVELFLELFLLSTVLIRLIWNIAILIHGFGHSAARALSEKNFSAINLDNILEQQHPIDVLHSLLPLKPIVLPGLQPSALWVEVGDKTPWKVRIKALGGPLFNLVALVLGLLCWQDANVLADSAGYFAPQKLTGFVAIAFVGSNSLILLSSYSDLVSLITGQAERFYCGNFGFIGRPQMTETQELLSRRVLELYTQMGHETEVRGEQAGGGLTLGCNKAGQIVFVGRKVVNSKRGNLTQTLEAKFAHTRRQAIRTGIKPLPSTVIGAWHYRFGTSGPPSVLETHWHEWTAAKLETAWQIEHGRWVAQSKVVNHRITHNGDFEAWKLFGQPVDYVTLGLWLERVLDSPNATVGDSPKIAGMMDLLITQGRWAASVRLAYQLTVATALTDVFGGGSPSRTAPNTAPPEALLHQWAAVFETAFSVYIDRLPDAESIFAPDQLRALKQDIFERLQGNPYLDCFQQQLKNFIEETVTGFFCNDVYRASQTFMAGALGSFGLVTLSTLEPNQLVLTALGQPITIGFDPQQRYAVYASEPSAVDAALAGRPDAYRLDLNQNTGEIALLSSTNLVIYSMTENRELKDSELMQRWVLMHNHPYLQRSRPIALERSVGRAMGQTMGRAMGQVMGRVMGRATAQSASETLDPVAQDLQDIPALLSNIQQTWMNPTSFNRQSAEYLLHFLI